MAEEADISRDELHNLFSPVRGTADPSVYEVRLALAFPPESALACWVAALSVVSNDLRTANEHLIASDGPDNAGRTEHQYFSRLLFSHVYEAIELIHLGLKKPQIRGFVAELPDKAQRLLAELLAASLPRGQSFLDQVLGRIRHSSFHYRTNKMAEALRHIRLHEPDLSNLAVVTPNFLDVRLHYAAELSNRLVVGTPSEMEATAGRALDLMAAVLGFAHQVIPRYLFKNAPAGSVFKLAGPTSRDKARGR